MIVSDVAEAIEELTAFADSGTDELYHSWWARLRPRRNRRRAEIDWPEATSDEVDWRVHAMSPTGACVVVRDGEEAVFEPGEYRTARRVGWVTDVRLLRWQDDNWYWRRSLQPFDPLGRRFRARLYLNVASDVAPRVLKALGDALDAEQRPFDGKGWGSDAEDRRDAVVLWVPLADAPRVLDVACAAGAEVEARFAKPPGPSLCVQRIGIAADPHRSSSYGRRMVMAAAHALALRGSDMWTAWSTACRVARLDALRPWRLDDPPAEQLWTKLERLHVVDDVSR